MCDGECSRPWVKSSPSTHGGELKRRSRKLGQLRKMEGAEKGYRPRGHRTASHVMGPGKGNHRRYGLQGGLESSLCLPR
ncbi:unnamed protein product [Lota lota]